MTTETQPETCPTCKTGTLVRTEARSDGHPKYFSCGHTQYSIWLEAELGGFHANLGYKAKSQGKGKPYQEGRTGDDLYRKTGKWMILERIIDRARNWYKELVTDPETGKVVHHCEEPVSQHRGHGSAKGRKEHKSE